VRWLVPLICAAALPAFATTPAVAATAHVAAGTFGEEGTGPGQFMAPSGVAVNSSSNLLEPAAGDVYVADNGNARVERFGPTGTFLGEFAPPGGFSAPEGIAVDSSEDPDPSAGDVYVVDSGHAVIDKFSGEGVFLGQLSEGRPGVPFGELRGIAVDAAGRLWVYQASSEIDKYDDALVNAYVGPEPALETGLFTTAGSGFAVDGKDNLYVTSSNRLVAKFNENASFLIGDISLTAQDPFGERTSAAVTTDLANNEVFVVTGGGVNVYSTTELESTSVESFGAGTLPLAPPEGPEGTGAAVNAASGRVYVTDPTASDVHIFDAVTLPDEVTGEATNLATEGHATLNGTVNPQGTEVVSCEFEYGTETSYGQSAPCSALPGSGSAPVPVSADISGLAPGTLYHFRLVAGNSNGSTTGGDRTFTAFALPKIDSESAVGVTTDSAILAAAINPGATDTTYSFEYGTTSSYGHTILGGHTGASSTDVATSVHAQGLQPGSLYHYRAVAINAIGKQVAGEDRTFTTRSTGGTAQLPDGRAWELVSPPEKSGATIEALTAEGGAIQAAEDGNRLAYVANAPTEAEPPGNPAKEVTEVLATRGPGGWSSSDIATPHDTATGVQAGNPSEYKLFSTDLARGLVEPIGEDSTPLAPAASEKTIYIRDNTSGSYEPLVTGENVPPETHFARLVTFTGATPDLEHVVLSSEVPLTAAPIANVLSLYELSAGQPQLVSRLPNREPAPVPALGFESHDVRNAISNDGSRVFWSAERHLFVSEPAAGETTQVDANQGGPPAGPEAQEAKFQMASADGSRVFFTDAELLTEDSTANPENRAADLYAYDVAAGKLTDLTVDHHAGESAEIQGAMLGAGENGSQVYVVAHGVLSDAGNSADEKAVSGGDNLYLVQSSGSKWEAPRFIATLAEADKPDWEGERNEGNLGLMTARVSPNGRYLAFMSARALTGYDNRDARSGQSDEEVFLYDSSLDRLTCVSCNPTGARPDGVFDSGEFPGLLVDRNKVWAGQWLAGSIPGWTLVDDFHAIRQSRYLSDDGRLFFTSADSLTSRDVNSVEDVYEYEPGGLGDCAQERGCVALLSSGESSEESAFLDASASGDDVFFVTAAQLAPEQDLDGSVDVYDAHVCTDASPCPPPATMSVSPPCSSNESCKAPPASQPGFAGSSTSTPSGAGNLPPPPAKATPTRAQKLAKALRQCRRIKRKRKRVACESSARKKYGPHKAAARKKGRGRHAPRRRSRS
jgi:hypothetical protein